MTPVVDAVLRRPKREYPSHCLDYLGSYRIFVDKIMLYLIKQWISGRNCTLQVPMLPCFQVKVLCNADRHDFLIVIASFLCCAANSKPGCWYRLLGKPDELAPEKRHNTATIPATVGAKHTRIQPSRCMQPLATLHLILAQS